MGEAPQGRRTLLAPVSRLRWRRHRGSLRRHARPGVVPTTYSRLALAGPADVPQSPPLPARGAPCPFVPAKLIAGLAAQIAAQIGRRNVRRTGGTTVRPPGRRYPRSPSGGRRRGRGLRGEYNRVGTVRGGTELAMSHSLPTPRHPQAPLPRPVHPVFYDFRVPAHNMFIRTT